MQTRSKSGIIKKKAFLAFVQDYEGIDLSTIKPSSYNSALKSHIWFKAMQDKLDAIKAQGTWTMVSLPFTKNLVGCIKLVW